MNENNGAGKIFFGAIIIAVCLILWVRLDKSLHKDKAQEPADDPYAQVTLMPEPTTEPGGTEPVMTDIPAENVTPEITVTPEATATPEPTPTPEPLEEMRSTGIELLSGTPAEVTDAAFHAAAEYMGALQYDGRWQKIICIGDSLTAGVQGAEGVSYQNPWPVVMRIFLNVSVENAGIGGSTIWHGGGDAMCHRVKQLGEADAIFIMGGANDWLCGEACPIGSPDEEGSFAYDANEMFAYVAENYPDADIFVILPLEPKKEPDTVGNTLEEFREAERKLAERYGFYIIDLASVGILNAKDPVVRENYYSDDIHLNTMGYQILGTLITSEALKMTD